MQYKYELHAHTKEGSSQCGRTKGSEIVRLYKEAGYDGVVITDHYSPLTFFPLIHPHPQNEIDRYISGYKNALAQADDNFTVLLGMEIRFYGTANDYLVYGVTEEFLKNNGNLMKLYVKNFSKLAHKNGLLFLQAHPCRGYITKADPKYLDGIEVFNGKAPNPKEHIKAQQWADEVGDKIQVSGSDFHTLPQLAKGGIITDTKICNNYDLIQVLKSGNYELIKNK